MNETGYSQEPHPLKIFTVLFLLILLMFFASLAFAQTGPTVTVRVTVEWVSTLDEDCDGPIFNTDCDFYTKVTIDDKQFQSSVFDDNNNNINPNWEYSKVDVPLSKGSVPIKIEIWDSDDNADDHYDFTRGEDPPSPDLNLTVDLLPCSVSSESYIRPRGTGYDQDSFTGACDISLFADGWSPRTGISFKIEVFEPSFGPDLGVRCLHTPIWPQAGQSVTIKAEALDGNTELKSVDDIKIYVNDKDIPRVSTAEDGPAGAKSTSYTFTPASSDQFFYGCRVQDNGSPLPVFTGWRVVQIDQPVEGRAVPILYTGPSASRLDFVFVADGPSFRDQNNPDFSGPYNPEFLEDVTEAIRDGYYAGEEKYRNAGRLLLESQETINFWIALDTGIVHATGEQITIDNMPDPPSNWGSDYTFANVGAILHRRSSTVVQRDSGEVGQRIFSTNIQHALGKGIRTLLHETGHLPFGLADEYCCNGAYSPTDPHPNTWFTENACLLNEELASIADDTCQQIRNPNDPSENVDWYRVDPASTYADDLMVSSGSLTPRPADKRRINWLFEQCYEGSCRKNR